MSRLPTLYGPLGRPTRPVYRWRERILLRLASTIGDALIARRERIRDPEAYRAETRVEAAEAARNDAELALRIARKAAELARAELRAARIARTELRRSRRRRDTRTAPMVSAPRPLDSSGAETGRDTPPGAPGTLL